VSNFVSIKFPNSPQQPKRVYSATLHQEIFKHDYAEIELRDWAVDPLNIKPGSLMTLTIRDKTYHGYVHDLEGNQDGVKNTTKIGFIGASFVMKQSSQKIYRNMSADQVVAEIATRYNFAYKVTPHPRVYTQISQAGMTDWQLMVKLAHECGYFLRAENTEVYFQPLTEDFVNLIGEAASFQKGDAGFKPINPIYTFKPLVSETLKQYGFKKAATSVAGVNAVNGDYFKITIQNSFTPSRKFFNQEFFDDHSTHQVANTYEEANYLSRASDEYSRFPYAASVEVMGTSSLRPCLPVYLKNVGPEYSGYWTILAVVHDIFEESLNHQVYTCQVQVASDSLGVIADPKLPKLPPAVPRRRIVPNERNKNIKPKTVMYLPSITSKRYQQTELVNRINRANQTGPFVATSRWGSTHRNLNYRPIDEKMPEAVWQKLRSNNV